MAIVTMILLTAAAAVQVQGQVLLQAFNWGAATSGSSPWYNVIAGLADDAAAAGVTDVWFPPPSQSVAAQGYLPGQLYNLDASKYGNADELRSAISALKNKGIRAVSDIVINHRTGSKQDSQGRWCIFEGGTSDGKLDWDVWAVCPNDQPYNCGTGNADTGEDYTAAPDLDHKNPTIQKELTDWLNWLKSDIGFQGWRFDFVKGYAGGILGDVYVDGTSPAFCVGEYYDGDTGKVANWISSTNNKCGAFDFPTKGILQNAINNNDFSSLNNGGKPNGIIGANPGKAVTFVDNHDTAPPQNNWPFPSDGEKILWGYAYIFTHPGVPSIFYDHIVDPKYKNAIIKLGNIRQRNNLTPLSNTDVKAAQSGLYVAVTDDKVMVKIGPNMDMGSNAPSADFKLATSGDGWAVWEKQ